MEQQLKASEEENAVQKLADLQSADDIITTRYVLSLPFDTRSLLIYPYSFMHLRRIGQA